MEDLILLDTSVLIDFFRKKNRDTSFLFRLSAQSNAFCISVITHFEISNGINLKQESFWSNFFSDILTIPYIALLNYPAVEIYQYLKKKRITVDFRDLIIAATAIQYEYQLATLNKKHFENIPNLKILVPGSI